MKSLQTLGQQNKQTTSFNNNLFLLKLFPYVPGAAMRTDSSGQPPLLHRAIAGGKSGVHAPGDEVCPNPRRCCLHCLALLVLPVVS